MKIAIITASIGQGHNAVALALEESLKIENPSNEIKVFDILDDSKVYQFLKIVYIEVITRTPYVYSKLFHWTYKHDKSTSIINYSDFLCLRILNNIKHTFKPDIFIFTHPFPATSYTNSLNIPAWTVITDYGFHPIWYNPKMSGYFVANSEVKDQICKKGYPRNAVINTGIPIKIDFYGNQPIKNTGTRDINNIPLVLIMGGGLGIGCLEEVVESLEEIEAPFKAIVLTGKNEELFQYITNSIKDKTPERWNVIPFSNEIPLLMKKASLLISKAGAVTLTEAGVSGLPTIIYKPIPGHEEKNAKFVCRQGWSRWAKDTNELINITNTLLSSDKKLEEMKRKSYKFNKLIAAQIISKTIYAYDFVSLRRSI